MLQLLKVAYTTFGGNLQSGSGSEPEINQLLLILSDGRGVFADGVQVCSLSKLSSWQLCLYFQSLKAAIRRLNDIGVFTVFVILDCLSKVFGAALLKAIICTKFLRVTAIDAFSSNCTPEQSVDAEIISADHQQLMLPQLELNGLGSPLVTSKALVKTRSCLVETEVVGQSTPLSSLPMWASKTATDSSREY